MTLRIAEAEVGPRLKRIFHIRGRTLGVAVVRSSGHDTVSLSRAVTDSLLANASSYCRVPHVL